MQIDAWLLALAIAREELLAERQTPTDCDAPGDVCFAHMQPVSLCAYECASELVDGLEDWSNELRLRKFQNVMF
jgi:hypothetical protein